MYSLGKPDSDSPVFVTANYTLSFDALRSALTMDCYILALDTKGVNVWCAAGKGTFGTEEIVNRVESTNLGQIVGVRKLILPQLGAPGVAAHMVKKLCRFKVEYGPVYAADIPEYMKERKATPEMRRVRFTLWDRITLVPLELVHVIIPTLAVACLLYILAGPLAASSAIVASFAGAVVFPILLPWIPGHDFSVKGLILGGVAAVPFAVISLSGAGGTTGYGSLGRALCYLAGMPPVTAFLALNFTGSTTFTSPSQVKMEILNYIPAMAWMFGVALVMAAALSMASYF